RGMSLSAGASVSERTILVATAVSLIWLPELLHVLGKVRRERVRLDRAVGVEAHRQVLADCCRRVSLSVEPAPGLVAVVDPDLVGLAEEREQPRLVRDVGLYLC